MKRFIVYFIEIIVCFIIQSAAFPYLSLADIMPNLLLIVVVSAAYMRGRLTGLTIGLVSGLLVDLIYGNNIIGLYALMYLIIGYFMGFTNRIYSNDDYTFPIIFIGVSDLFYGFMYYVFQFLLRGKLNFLYYLRRFILPEMIYTVAVSILLYKLLHMIHNRLERKPEEEV